MCSQGAEDHEVPRPEAPEKDTAPRPCLIARVPIIRVRDGESLQLTDSVARESSLVLLVNGRVLCRLQCSPAQLEELALGFLYTAGLLAPQARDVPTTCEVRETETLVDVQVGIPDEDVARLRESLVAGTGCGLGLFAAKGLDPLDCGRKIDTSFRVKAVELILANPEYSRTSSRRSLRGGKG